MDEAMRGAGKKMPQPLGMLRDGARFAAISARLARLLRRHRADVIDARMTYAIIFGLAAGRLAGGIPVVGTEYFNEFWGGSRWRQRAAPHVFRRLACLVSDSEAAVAQYRPWLASPDRARVVYNGISPPHAERSAAEVRATLGLPDDGSKVVAMVARLVPYKGQHVFVEAARKLLEQRDDLRFLVCGYPGLSRAYIDRLHRTAGGHPRITIAGYPHGIEDVWQLVDIHVHSSFMDSSPMAILEAMASGLPAVHSTAGGIPELGQHGVSCLQFEPGDSDGLAQCIARIVDEPGLAERLGQGARQRYKARHQPAHLVDGVGEVFASVAR